MMSESQVLLTVNILRYVDDTSTICVQKIVSQNETEMREFPGAKFVFIDLELKFIEFPLQDNCEGLRSYHGRGALFVGQVYPCGRLGPGVRLNAYGDSL